jgi:hypothetical protein
MKTSGTVCLALASVLLPATAAAQNCSGNIDLSGPYEFTLSRLVWTPVAFVPPGTTTDSMLTSTELGVKRTGQQGSFASQGRVVADGAGTLFVQDAGSSTVRAGTYSVSLDCALTLSLDGHEPPPGDGATVAQRAKASFRGFLRNRGDEAALVQSGTSAGPGAQLRLTRPFRFTGCSNASLSGLYGLVATGIRAAAASSSGGSTGGSAGGSTGGSSTGGSGVTAPTDPAPFAMFGQMLADGNGHFITPASGGAGLLTGTYSVENDCTGNGTIQMQSESLDFSFVLVDDPYAGRLNRPALHVTMQGDRIAATGLAR